MKNHFLSLFDTGHFRKTILLLIVATVLIIASLIIGTTDNLPIILMLFTGMITFYFALFHSWEKPSSFATLGAICLILLVLDFIYPTISEGFAMTVGFIFFAGFITAIIGLFTRIKGWNRIPYAGSLLSLVALLILISSISHVLVQVVSTDKVDILIGLQFLITLVLLGIGIQNKKESLLTKTLLVITPLTLVLLIIGALYASTFQFKENAPGFTALALRIYAFVQLLVIALTLYAGK